jgi:hypothetical protein
MVIEESQLPRLNAIVKFDELIDWMDAWSIPAVYELYSSGMSFLGLYERLIESRYQKKTEVEFTTIDYKDYKLYTAKDGEYVITFLSDRMLLLGTTEAVKDTIDVRNGDREPVNSAILDTYNRLGDALIKLAFELPEEARKALTTL